MSPFLSRIRQPQRVSTRDRGHPKGVGADGGQTVELRGEG